MRKRAPGARFKETSSLRYAVPQVDDRGRKQRDKAALEGRAGLYRPRCRANAIQTRGLAGDRQDE